VTQPAQQPPGACGVHAALCVVSHDLLALFEATRSQVGDQLGAIRQGMAAIGAGLRAGQVVIQMQILRTRDVAGGVGLFAGPGVGQIETAVNHEDAAWRSGEPFREVRRGDQCGVVGVWHDGSFFDRS
jgi:hypothetical protein